MDFTPLDGPPNEKGKTGHGLYSLEGDVLKICLPMSPDTDERPTELATKEGGKALLLTLKREKPTKEKPKGDKPEADKQAIQGVWQVTDFEANGNAAPEKAEVIKKIKTAKWIFTAHKMTYQLGGKDSPADYTLDPSKTPKEIDFMPLDDPNNVKPQLGLYSLEGDTLKLCLPGPQEGPRPTKMAADDAGKNVLLTLKRVSAVKEKPKDNAKVKKLLQDLLDTANDEYRMREQAFRHGTAPLDQLAGAARRILTAELERSENKEGRVKACEEYLQRITEVAKHAMASSKAGQATQADALEAEYYRLEAEIMLEREKAK